MGPGIPRTSSATAMSDFHDIDIHHPPHPSNNRPGAARLLGAASPSVSGCSAGLG